MEIKILVSFIACIFFLKTAPGAPVLAAEDDRSNNTTEKSLVDVDKSQIYLAGRKEGEVFYKQEEFFFCDKNVNTADKCKSVQVNICQKVYRSKDGSLYSRQTCQESCYKLDKSITFIPATCIHF